YQYRELKFFRLIVFCSPSMILFYHKKNGFCTLKKRFFTIKLRHVAFILKKGVNIFKKGEACYE
ncbi:MAG: hypothetical protein K2N27_10340, partial [Ruminococcus sp.]|nr:hypothetical protein [Ruminococcus sp.]